MVLHLKPAEWLDPSKVDVPGTLLLVLNRPITNEKLLRRAWEYTEHRVLLDGAASLTEKFNLRPDFVVGDGDSITAETLDHLAEIGVEFVKDPNQNTTDFMKAIEQSHKRFAGIHTVYAFGALGGRVDHSWHSQYMLARSLHEKYTLYLLSSQNITAAIDGEVEIDTPRDFVGPTCGIVPVESSVQMTTKGLVYDVQDWETSWYTQLSTSNSLAADSCTISSTGPMFFTVEIRNK